MNCLKPSIYKEKIHKLTLKQTSKLIGARDILSMYWTLSKKINARQLQFQNFNFFNINVQIIIFYLYFL